MKYYVLMGSPRRLGNTAALTASFLNELNALDAKYESAWLYEKRIEPCVACRSCQKDWLAFGCPHKDDVQEIFNAILSCETLVLATPIYSWYCTPPMKALLDRLVYGMNKYYGDEKGPSLWEGKRLALITTCGYQPEKGADLWETGMTRYCKHSRLQYAGMLVERDQGYETVFLDKEKDHRARLFARELESAASGQRYFSDH
ncbi:MAG: flavodoxin family protein [Synergistaceae bacterium]|jgi:multimeric flavodoxin WrbA|nr:flavodoxin family protein [Synergistaceae bacterium]